MREGPAEPPQVDRAADDAETDAAPYSPPQVTPLGTLAELTSGTLGGDGGDISAYAS